MVNSLFGGHSGHLSESPVVLLCDCVFFNHYGQRFGLDLLKNLSYILKPEEMKYHNHRC